MIEKMRHALQNHEKVQLCYDELTRFVQAESEKELSFFEEAIS